MSTEQYHQIIILYRLRERARKLMAANRKAGNRLVADMYVQIDRWLASQMEHAVSACRRK